jgi:nucleoside-diphosphate-sugar epimerase
MPDKVLVTGGSGYLGSWIVKKLVDKGYTVHATVRDKDNNEKTEHLRELGDSVHLFNADLLQEGSFAEAIKGCKYVIHSASPFLFGKIKDPQNQLVEPALVGTENVLGEATKTPGVEKVIVTASVVTLYGDAKDTLDYPNQTVTEESWNNTSTLEHQSYSYSKVLAEKKAWELQKSQSQWALNTVHPGFILGPSLSKRIDSVSNRFVRDMMNGVYKTGVPDFYYAFVDVRDVAEAHVAAMESDEQNHRFFAVADVLPMIKMAELLKEKFGKKYKLPKSLVPKWLLKLLGPALGFSRKSIEMNYGIQPKIDKSRTDDLLKLQYQDPKATLVDHAEQLISQNLVKQ